MKINIGIIGGSGIYDASLLEDAEEVEVDTPFGKPSDKISIGTYKGKRVAFLARHGKNHSFPPHLVNYRANIWALKQLGVSAIIAVNACGSLREEFRPRDIVVLDQFIDETRGRVGTFFEGKETNLPTKGVAHVGVAEPFCPEIRKAAIAVGNKLGIPLKERGTYVCIQGPRFSTKAESEKHRILGADVVGMTLFPEAALAREAELCYISLALVTDYDVWKEGRVVTNEEVLRVVKENQENAKKLVFSIIENLGERNCGCRDALKGSFM